MNVGERIGPYEITARLGAGGMGEVWRATDARLKRDVAIKVLPAGFTAEPERLARFEREAQLLAQLHHPNIAAVYGFEEANGATGASGAMALVMELVEGEDLAARIARGPLPVDEAVAIARQITEALEAAHARGIVHRDLKPANVKLRSDGTVKVLDFGLAKAMEPPGSGATGNAAASELQRSPTLTLGATTMGVILGTAGYMSPEQAKGSAVDARADVWAFGVVLWEMLTGRRLFDAPSVPETLAQVLTQRPELDALPATTPASVRRVVRRCLERDPRQRLHDIADARIELTQPDADDAVATVAPARARGVAGWAGWAIAAAAVALAAWLAIATPRRASTAAEPPMRLQLVPGGAERLVFDSRAFALSPDGSKLVYEVEKGATSELRLRTLASDDSVAIAGTDGAVAPFFSPDGRSIGFFAGGKLRTVAVAGGAPVVLADAPEPRGATWGDDGAIYFVPTLYVPVSRVPATGGSVEKVTTLRPGELQHRWPDLVPGGTVLVYAIGSGGEWDDATIVAERLDTHQRTVLVRGGTWPRVLPGNVLVYARAGSLYALAFDPGTLAAVGQAVEVARGVRQDPRGYAQADIARSGLLVTTAAGSLAASTRFAWIDRRGAGEPLAVDTPDLAAYAFTGEGIVIAPDGRRAVLGMRDGLFVLDVDRGSFTPLTLRERAENPVWSADGRTIFFGYELEKHYQVFSKPADDSGSPQLRFPSDAQEDPYAVAADGSLLSLRLAGDGVRSLRVHDLTRPQASPRTLVSSPALLDTTADFSPDGRFVVYGTQQAGRPEVFVRPASGQDRKWQISVDGGTWPRWSPRGDEIFFLRGPQLLAAKVEVRGDELVAGRPVVLFDTHRIAAFDVTPDGQRFLVAEDPDPGARPHLDVVVNWSAEVLRRLAEARTP